jgi:hypothetical protein
MTSGVPDEILAPTKCFADRVVVTPVEPATEIELFAADDDVMGKG